MGYGGAGTISIDGISSLKRETHARRQCTIAEQMRQSFVMILHLLRLGIWWIPGYRNCAEIWLQSLVISILECMLIRSCPFSRWKTRFVSSEPCLTGGAFRNGMCICSREPRWSLRRIDFLPVRSRRSILSWSQRQRRYWYHLYETHVTLGVEEVFLAISRKLVEQREEIEDAREALMHGRRHYSSVHPDDAPRPRGGRGCTC
jgi:hypothetical protein